jgi:hypothetical protein
MRPNDKLPIKNRGPLNENLDLLESSVVDHNSEMTVDEQREFIIKLKEELSLLHSWIGNLKIKATERVNDCNKRAEMKVKLAEIEMNEQKKRQDTWRRSYNVYPTIVRN